MKTKNILTVVAAAAFAVFAQGSFAQASAPTRAEVKADAPAAPLAPARPAAPHCKAGRGAPSRPARTSHARPWSARP